MKIEQVKDIITAQKHCLLRNCNRRCKKCDLARDQKDIVLAYDEVISLIDDQKAIKTEFFNSGVEYAKNEFTRLLENEKDNVGEQHKQKALNDLMYTQVLGLQKAIEITGKLRGKG